MILFLPTRMNSKPLRRAFTMNELLVSLFIVGLLFALTMQAIGKVRESANRLVCQHHLGQLALATHAYHAGKKTLPPYMTGTSAGQLYGGWYAHLLPYVGEEPLYLLISEHDEGLKDAMIPAIWSPKVRGRRFPILRCESDPSLPTDSGTTNYLANWYAFTRGNRGAYSVARPLSDLEDGPSNVVLFGEAYSVCQRTIRHTFQPPRFHNFGITAEGKASDDPAYSPNDYAGFQIMPAQCDPWRTQSPHSAMQTALADGSTRIISLDISAEVWLQLLKPADGDPHSGAW